MHLQPVQTNYRRLAHNYDARWAAFNDAAHGWVLDRLDGARNVIDMGCGTGRLLAQIHNRYPAAALTGLDASPDMLAVAAQTVPAAHLLETDLMTYETARKFDAVLSINVLHHLPDAAYHIGSLHRLCAANAAVFLCDFAIEGLVLNAAELYWRTLQPAHRRAFSQAALKELLTDSFTIEDEALLRPDRFWRLQIYRLKPKTA